MSETPVQPIPKYVFSPVEAIKEGYEIFKKAPSLMILVGLLFVIIEVLVSKAPSVGSLLSLLITPLLVAGFYNIVSKVKMTGSASLNDAIDGVKNSKIDQLMLYGVVQGLIVGIGFLLLVIPGIYLMVAYYFAVPYIFFGRMGFWEAMEKSRRVITEQWFSFFGFTILIGLLNLAGLLVLGVGVLVTIPISFCAVYAAFTRVAEQVEKPAAGATPEGF